ncbi:MAG: pyridoxal phosphate-dependent aminotransferase [Candidatus Omnitrophica bacterium]|nr:pyridoxal phosphate-dependent aminotransferase [Candidatus Omnitrophota bacterium]
MSNFLFANRTNWSLQSNPLSCLLEKLQAQGVDILDLTESNPTRCGFHYPSSWLEALCGQNNFTYAPQAKGLIQARRAVADYYAQKSLNVDPKRIVLTSSTSEGYSFLLKLLTNPGDHVLIPKPSYPLFQFLLQLHDVEFDYYPLVYDGAWRTDQRAFKNLVMPKTRTVIVVNPNNPAGSYVGKEDIAFLNEQCLKNHMAIISDEVFFDYKLNGQINPLSLAYNTAVPTFVLSGISKILGLPQMKLSWITSHGPQPIVDMAMDRLEIIADTYLSVNTPAQNALSVWLAGNAHIQKQILERVRANWEIVRRQHLNVLAAEGGWYALVHVPSVKSEEQLVLDLLQKDHVLVHPGYFFDFDNPGYLVLSLLPVSEIFTQALERICRRIKLL